MKQRSEWLFYLEGRPVPKSRMTQRGKWSPRAKKTLAYQEFVAYRALAQGIPQLEGLIELTAIIELRNPRVRGDLSNYIKAIEDGLQRAGILRNDRAIVRYGMGTGIYAGSEDRVLVKLRVLGTWDDLKPAKLDG